jgi:hypothetical protein
MNWIKQGLIYTSNGEYEWNQTHAQVPVVDVLNEQVWRIYYSARDRNNKSNTSYIEVEAGNPARILYKHNQPILTLGRLGTFDESGLMPSWIIEHKGIKYLYYIGWSVKQTVPYHNAIGLAISEDGGKHFEKFSEGPLFDISYREPYFTGTSCVLIENDIWKNWYLSCTKWEIINGKPEAFYHIKYAESKNGIDWERKGIVAINYKDNNEAGIVKASVFKENNLYKMWYSYRGAVEYRSNTNASYKIGYAESVDGIHWERKDEHSGIELSANGWDSEMMAYPHVVSYKGKKFMFYNGNGFGRSGFGYATR